MYCWIAYQARQAIAASPAKFWVSFVSGRGSYWRIMYTKLWGSYRDFIPSVCTVKYILTNLRLSSASESRHSCCTRLYYPCIRNCHNILSTLTDEDFASEKKAVETSRLLYFSGYWKPSQSCSRKCSAVSVWSADSTAQMHSYCKL